MIQPEMPPRTSQRLLALAASPTERLSIADILAAFGERGYGLLLLVLTLPNAVPLPGPPGMSAVLAIPLILVAMQMALGYRVPRLPARLRRVSFRRERVQSALERIRPLMDWVERRLRPRHLALTSTRAEPILGLFCLGLALLLALPVPLGNAPVAWALLIIALGLLERDGLYTTVGLVVGFLGLAWNTLLIFAGSHMLAFLTTLW